MHLLKEDIERRSREDNVMGKTHVDGKEAIGEEQVIQRRTRISQQDIPVYSLEDALKIPRAIIENRAGRPSTPIQVAQALNIPPDSRRFRDLCGSAIAYGLTNGGYNANRISVQELARGIITPIEEGQEVIAKREAALKPRIIGEFIKKYDGSPLPRRDIALNVLTELRVPRERADSIYNMILDTAGAIGIIKVIQGKQYIEIGAEVIQSTDEEGGGGEAFEESGEKVTEGIYRGETEEKKELGKGIFIAHGKNKKPLEQLKKILDQFRVPYKVAVDEPNLGRPISSKAKEIMEACNCAILVFTCDEEFLDKEGKSIWRPSENVVYELGASNYLYDNRIVILKEEGVQFPSNFSDIGYIAFKKDQLESKSLDVIKELIGFGIVKVST